MYKKFPSLTIATRATHFPIQTTSHTFQRGTTYTYALKKRTFSCSKAQTTPHTHTHLGTRTKSTRRFEIFNWSTILTFIYQYHTTSICICTRIYLYIKVNIGTQASSFCYLYICTIQQWSRGKFEENFEENLSMERTTTLQGAHERQ